MDFLLEFGTSHSNDLFRCKEPYFSSRAKGNIYDFVESYKENCEKTAGKGLMCMFSGNHDVDRLARHLHGDELKDGFLHLSCLCQVRHLSIMAMKSVCVM